ncbi:MAG: recombinase RarA, partial [Treponema sp.]|jgi:putative ATPase|nr:recombinase RarA [Treponema sp.]
MIILASEDVGLADPQALGVVLSCAGAFDRIGFPEGNFPLAHACLYLATAPKSNTAMAFFDAMKEVEKEDAEVPNHLRDPSRDAEGFGHGEGYVYPHAYRDHWAAQQYLPTSLKGRAFYIPSLIGYEGKIREEVLKKRELQAAIVLGDSPGGETRPADGEILTWSAASKGREGWFKRLESGRSALLLADRDRIFNAASIARHDRVLIPLGNDGLLLWESLRRAPEGLSAALADSEPAREALLRYARTLDETEAPEIAVHTGTVLPAPERCAAWFSTPRFDHILLREPWRRGFGKVSPKNAAGEAEAAAAAGAVFTALAQDARKLLAPGGNIILLSSPPLLGERISRILGEECGAGGDLAAKMAEAETAFFSPAATGGNSPGKTPAAEFQTWDGDTLEKAFRDSGFTVEITPVDQHEERLVTGRDLDLWFDRSRSRWGAFLGERMGEKDFSLVRQLLRERIQEGPLVWKWKSLLLRGSISEFK